MRTHISSRVLSYDPTSDLLFKYLFEVKQTLIPFLNWILHLAPNHQIVDLTYLGQEENRSNPIHRGVIFDLRVLDQQGVTYNVEIQKADEPAFLLRGLYYATRLMSKQLQKGDSFFKLQPTSVVLLTLFDLYPDELGTRVFWMTPYEVSAQTKGLNSEEMRAFQLSNHPNGYSLEGIKNSN